MTLTEHAKNELELAGFFDEKKDFYGGKTGKDTLELVKVFAKQRHSGMSAAVVRGLFQALAAFQPLTPLTGEPDEWNNVSDLNNPSPSLFQNKRCSKVFADDENGKNARNIAGKVFVEPEGGAAYTNNNSSVPVVFPYIPKTEYINVEGSDS